MITYIYIYRYISAFIWVHILCVYVYYNLLYMRIIIYNIYNVHLKLQTMNWVQSNVYNLRSNWTVTLGESSRISRCCCQPPLWVRMTRASRALPELSTCRGCPRQLLDLLANACAFWALSCGKRSRRLI